MPHPKRGKLMLKKERSHIAQAGVENIPASENLTVKTETVSPLSASDEICIITDSSDDEPRQESSTLVGATNSLFSSRQRKVDGCQADGILQMDDDSDATIPETDSSGHDVESSRLQNSRFLSSKASESNSDSDDEFESSVQPTSFSSRKRKRKPKEKIGVTSSVKIKKRLGGKSAAGLTKKSATTSTSNNLSNSSAQADKYEYSSSLSDESSKSDSIFQTQQSKFEPGMFTTNSESSRIQNCMNKEESEESSDSESILSSQSSRKVKISSKCTTKNDSTGNNAESKHFEPKNTTTTRDLLLKVKKNRKPWSNSVSKVKNEPPPSENTSLSRAKSVMDSLIANQHILSSLLTRVTQSNSTHSKQDLSSKEKFHQDIIESKGKNDSQVGMSNTENIESMNDSQATVLVSDDDSNSSSSMQQKPYSRGSDSTVLYWPSEHGNGIGLNKQTSNVEQNSVVDGSVDSKDSFSATKCSSDYPVISSSKCKVKESVSPQVSFQDEHLKQSSSFFHLSPDPSFQKLSLENLSSCSMPTLLKRPSDIVDEDSMEESSPPPLSQYYLTGSVLMPSSSTSLDSNRPTSFQQSHRKQWEMMSHQKGQGNSSVQMESGLGTPMFSQADSQQSETSTPEPIKIALEMLRTESICVEERKEQVEERKEQISECKVDDNRNDKLMINVSHKGEETAGGAVDDAFSDASLLKSRNNQQESVGNVSVSVTLSSGGCTPAVVKQEVDSDTVTSNVDYSTFYSQVDDTVYVFDSDDDYLFQTQFVTTNSDESSCRPDEEESPNEGTLWSDDEDVYGQSTIMDKTDNRESDGDTIFEGFQEENQIFDVQTQHDGLLSYDSDASTEPILQLSEAEAFSSNKSDSGRRGKAGNKSDVWDCPTQVKSDSDASRDHDISDDDDLYGWMTQEVDTVHSDNDDDDIWQAKTQIDDSSDKEETNNDTKNTRMEIEAEVEESMIETRQEKLQAGMNSTLTDSRGGLDVRGIPDMKGVRNEALTQANESPSNSAKSCDFFYGDYEDRTHSSCIGNQPVKRHSGINDSVGTSKVEDHEVDIFNQPTQRFDDDVFDDGDNDTLSNLMAEIDKDMASDSDSNSQDKWTAPTQTFLNDVRKSAKDFRHVSHTDEIGEEGCESMNVDTIQDTATQPHHIEDPYEIGTQVDSEPDVSDDSDIYMKATQVDKDDTQDPYQVETLPMSPETANQTDPFQMETLEQTHLSQASSCSENDREVSEKPPTGDTGNKNITAVQPVLPQSLYDRCELGSRSRPADCRSISLDQANIYETEKKTRTSKKAAAVKRSASDSNSGSTWQCLQSRDTEGRDSAKSKSVDQRPSQSKSVTSSVQEPQLQAFMCPSSNSSQVMPSSSSTGTDSSCRPIQNHNSGEKISLTSCMKHKNKASAPKPVDKNKFKSLTKQPVPPKKKDKVICADGKNHISVAPSAKDKKGPKLSKGTGWLSAKKVGSPLKQKNINRVYKRTLKQASPAQKPADQKTLTDKIAAARLKLDQRRTAMSAAGPVRDWRESKSHVAETPVMSSDLNDDVEMPATQDIVNQGLPILTANLPISKKHFKQGLPSQGRVASEELSHKKMNKTDDFSITCKEPQNGNGVSVAKTASPVHGTRSLSGDAEPMRFASVAVPRLLSAASPGTSQTSQATRPLGNIRDHSVVTDTIKSNVGGNLTTVDPVLSTGSPLSRTGRSISPQTTDFQQPPAVESRPPAVSVSDRPTASSSESPSKVRGVLKGTRAPEWDHRSRPKASVQFRETANIIHPIERLPAQKTTIHPPERFSAPRNTMHPVERLPAQNIEAVLDFLQIVLKWRPEWLEEQVKVTSGMPPLFGGDPERRNPKDICIRSRLYYNNFKEYVKITSDLLVLELWEMVTRDWNMILKEKKTQIPPKMKLCVQIKNKPEHPCANTKQRGLLNVTVTGAIGERERVRLPLQLDFLILYVKGYSKGEGKPTQLHQLKKFAYVKSIKVSSRTEDKKKFLENHKRQFPQDHQNFESSPAIRDLPRNVLTYEMVLVILHREYFYNTELIEFEKISTLMTVLRQLSALKCMQENTLCKELLHPQQNSVFDHKSQASPGAMFSLDTASARVTLNAEQASAVTNIRRAVLQNSEGPKVFLLQGPPGTGKTGTILTLIRHIVESSQYKARICLATPSNAAVDEVAKRVLKLSDHLKAKGLKPISLLRVGNPNSVHPEVQRCTLDELVRQAKALKDSTAKGQDSLKTECEIYKREASRLKELLSRQTLDRRQRAINETKLEEHKRQIQKIEKELGPRKCTPREQYELECWTVDHANVICGTLSSFGSEKVKRLLLRQKDNVHKAQAFSCLIIDEATQAIEVDCLIPLQYKITKLILVGDQEQLPATVLSQVACDKMLNRSLFERLCQCLQQLHPPPPVWMLTRQYRMHKEILSLPNSFFYNGQLETDESVERREAVIAPYLVFNVLDSRESRSGGHNSSVSNESETFCTGELCQEITRLGANHPALNQIGVICPYVEQKRAIVGLLRDRQLRNIEVNTIDSFQGQERNVIIYSCVRAQENPTRTSIGFVADRRRMNVALTRAKLALYVIGNLKTLETDKLWGELFRDAQDRGLLVDVPTQKDFRRMARERLQTSDRIEAR